MPHLFASDWCVTGGCPRHPTHAVYTVSPSVVLQLFALTWSLFGVSYVVSHAVADVLEVTAIPKAASRNRHCFVHIGEPPRAPATYSDCAAVLHRGDNNLGSLSDSDAESLLRVTLS